MIDVITESGTVYRLDFRGKWWRRFDSDVRGDIPREKLYRLQSSPVVSLGDTYLDWKDVSYPIIGEYMYLASRNLWYRTMPVVEIIPVDSWEAPKSSPRSLPST